ncbi:MAG TPA: hypothetical protein VF681_04565 [Abditibacteriaceae bacterium]|jgi:hypothetical protein
MEKRQIDNTKTQTLNLAVLQPLTVDEFEQWAQDYLLGCELRRQSPATISGKKDVFSKVVWFMRAATSGFPRPSCADF